MKRKIDPKMKAMKIAMNKILNDRFIKDKQEDILIDFLRWSNKRLFHIQQVTIISLTIIGFILTFLNNILFKTVGYTLMLYGVIFLGILIIFYFPLVMKQLKLIMEAFDFDD